MAVVKHLYEEARDLLLGSARTLLLTGAGVSTGSGIPDFRSPGKGMWEFVDPFAVAYIWGFRAQPELFYRWIRPLAEKMLRAQPNPAHWGFASLQGLGLLHTVVTQNIDDLHEQAGTKDVVHVHGNAQSARCLECGRRVDGKSFWSTFLAGTTMPLCPECGAVLKPDVVLFGEELQADLLAQAQEAALTSDLVIVAGASLEVMPTADLPLLAKRRGARLLLLNLGATMLDEQADLIIREDVARSVPRLMEMCRAYR